MSNIDRSTRRRLKRFRRNGRAYIFWKADHLAVARIIRETEEIMYAELYRAKREGMASDWSMM